SAAGALPLGLAYCALVGRLRGSQALLRQGGFSPCLATPVLDPEEALLLRRGGLPGLGRRSPTGFRFASGSVHLPALDLFAPGLPKLRARRALLLAKPALAFLGTLVGGWPGARGRRPLGGGGRRRLPRGGRGLRAGGRWRQRRLGGRGIGLPL